MIKEKIRYDYIKADKITAVILPAFLFAVSFIYLYFLRNSLFFYQEGTSLFICSDEYLQKFINKPGGLLEYTGNFLMQGYFSPLYGASVLTLINVIFYFLIVRTGKILTGKISIVRLFALLPAFTLLLLQTGYEHFMHYNLGFILISCYFLLCISSKNRHLQLILISILPAFYYVTGSFAIIFACLYICWSVLYEKGVYRSLMPALILLICTITWFLFKEVLFYQPVEKLTGYPLPFNDLKRFNGLLLFLSLYIILYPLLIKIIDKLKVREKISRVLVPSLQTTVVIMIIISLIKLYNPDLVRIMQLEKMVALQDWDGIIRQQERFPVANIFAQYYYNLALTEKGILCERMFHAPQDFGPNSLCLPRLNEYYNRSVHFYYTIGLINAARHIAYESMIAYGYRPGNIKILIKTELINGNFRVAEKYINDLKRTLHYRKWAEKYEKMLYKPETVLADKELAQKIMILPGTDFFIRPDDRENINLLFLSNPVNFKAFEYRMAWMLLEKDYKTVVNEIRMMKMLGYKIIPRHLEEAVVGFTNITKIFPDLGGLSLRADAENDFFEYGSAYNLYSNRKELLSEEMKRLWGKTYWYYLQFK
ncbi:MAG TPA: hypothetical protein DDW27_10120 [Bacteroidales bacterium]|nr:hypothetical protein [Bacteroidales bacterium]